jgi:hypothetical protein
VWWAGNSGKKATALKLAVLNLFKSADAEAPGESDG